MRAGGAVWQVAVHLGEAVPRALLRRGVWRGDCALEELFAQRRRLAGGGRHRVWHCSGGEGGGEGGDLFEAEEEDETPTPSRKRAAAAASEGEDEDEAQILDDEDDVMPPLKHHKPLSQKEKETIRQWIESGAEYEPHWAYTSIKKPQGNVDQLASKKLKEHKLDFSEEADKRTLVRRLSFDLRGLPASPQEIQIFLKDSSPDAWSKLIDKFLASPAFGEKMAVMWLDLVRYADTVGYHGDQIQHVEAYRDYVIKAFNKNMPFDQFTKEQLAGDLLPNPTQDQLIASAYNRLNMMSREGGAQESEYLAKYAQDRVATTSIAWMGSTLACAECHDHKYDPFTAKDFYAFAAFFSDIQQVGVYNRNPSGKGGLRNEDPFPPYITLNQPEIDAAINPIKADLAKSEEIKNFREFESHFLYKNYKLNYLNFCSNRF